MSRPAAGVIARGILSLATPIFISQLAGIGTHVADTLITGHHSTADLAAVAVGGGLFVSVAMALVGVLHAAAPIIAHHVGAGHDEDIAPAFQQAVWMALFLALPGVLLLVLPGPLLALAELDPQVEQKTRAYLLALACALPGALLFRAFQALMNGIGAPRPVMVIMLVCVSVHVPLAWALTTGAFGPALGALGCGLSTLVVNWLSAALGVAYLVRSRRMTRINALSDWQAPRAWAQRELLRLGGPMGLSSFIGISSFTLIAIFVARLGADAVAGHRIIANLNGVCFMLPLALGSGTMIKVGQAVGAHDALRARLSALTGLAIAGATSTAAGIILWMCRDYLPIVYRQDAAVQAIAASLMPLVVLFVVADSVQTLASFALRGFKITVAPMLAHAACFWGFGVTSGYVLAFHGMPWTGLAALSSPMGVSGFWLATLVSTALAGVLITLVLLVVLRSRTGTSAAN